MKKKLLITLAVMLLAVTLSAVVSALSIDYCNLSFKDSVYIKYAVDADSADVKLLIWTEPQADYRFGTQDDVLEAKGTENIEGTDYYIFDYTKLAARQMTDYVYARAYDASTGSYSDTVKYSILKYAYNKLGKTSVNAEEAMKPILENMLNYGASAQTYFNYKADRLANENFYEVRLTNGTLAEDGFVSGLYLEGEDVAIKADATDGNGVPFAAWKDSTGAVVGTTAEYTVTVGTKNEVYTAVYSDGPVVDYSEGLEYATNDDGTCYVASIGDCTDTDIIIPEKDPITGDTVIGIDANAFNGEAITSITIPSTVVEIGRRAFYSCDSLTDVYYHGTSADWAGVEVHATGNDALTNAEMHYLKVVEYTETTLAVKSVTATAGQKQVEVVVEIFNNPGIAGMVFSVEYDMNNLSLVNATKGNALALTEIFPNVEDLDTGNTSFAWVGSSSPAKDGSVIVLTFDVKDTATANSYPIKLSYEDRQIVDNNSQPIDVDLVNGNVTVTE